MVSGCVADDDAETLIGLILLAAEVAGGKMRGCTMAGERRVGGVCHP